MKTRPFAFITVIFVLAVPHLFAQGTGPERCAGSWLGELKAGAVTLRIVINITINDDTLAATMDSPDEMIKGIPVSKVDVGNNSIVMEVKASAGFFSGKISADGKSIDGTWTQGGADFPLLLSKLEGAFTLDRPQEPGPPFPYTSLEVKFANAKAKIELAGTLTVPQGKGPFPALVLVTGSGQQNRDEALMGHRPFAVLVDRLSRGGIAVLRYDDRGTAGSRGDFAAATTFDFADDAEAAFAFLASRREVNPGRVGIAGHSEGGIIAPIVAARNPRVAFIVLLAGPGLPGDRLLLLQNEAIDRASGADEKSIAEKKNLYSALYAIAKRSGDAAGIAADLKQAFQAYLDAIDAATTLPPSQKADAMRAFEVIAVQLTTPWWRAFLALDPAAYLSKVRVPILALNGTKDLQVPAAENLAAVEAALKAGGNTRYKIVTLDGLNHLFQHAGTGLPAEYGKLTETFAPEALSLIRGWIPEK